MKESTPPASESLITGAEIARLAGVTRAAVANWRRRYSDFPAPADGGAGAPIFSLTEVRSWLAKQQKGTHLSDDVRLWQALRGAFGDDMVAGIAGAARFLAHEDDSRLDDKLADLAARVAAKESAAQVIDQLVERFLDSSRRAGSDQVTSLRLVKAVRHFVGPVSDDSVILDPACGIGTLLLSVGLAKGPVRRGQEIDPAAEGACTGASRAHGATGHRHRGRGLSPRGPLARSARRPCPVRPPGRRPGLGPEELLLDARWELGTPSKAEGDWPGSSTATPIPPQAVGPWSSCPLPWPTARRAAGSAPNSSGAASLPRRRTPARHGRLHALPVHLWALKRPASPSEPPTGAHGGPHRQRARRHHGAGRRASRRRTAIELLDDTVDLTPAAHVDASRQDVPAEYRALQRGIEKRLHRLTALLPALTAGEGPGTLDNATISSHPPLPCRTRRLR